MALQKDSNLSQLIFLFHETISKMGYSRTLLSYYRNYGQMLIKYAEQNGRTDCFNLDLAQDFLRDCFEVSLYQTPGEGKHPTRIAIAIRMMRLLEDMAHQRPFMNKYPRKNNFPLPQQYEELLAEYKQHLKNYRDYEDRSLYEVQNSLRRFMHFIFVEISQPLSELSNDIVTQYIVGMQHFHPATIKSHCKVIKAFFQYLYEKQYIFCNVSTVVPSVRVCRQAKIPSVWKKDDIVKLLGIIDRGSPGGKRDYAILLLASRVGLRATDIRSLKFHDLKWSSEKDKSRMEIIQSKTKRLVVIPILPDVGWAIIDYIQHGRPQVDSPYVFLRHNAPFEPFEPNNGLNNIIKKYANLAGIELNAGKKNGMHSLRHSFASNLVANHTPMETVMGLMGHANTNSTSVYMKVDISSLRLCTLDPLEVIRVEE